MTNYRKSNFLVIIFISIIYGLSSSITNGISSSSTIGGGSSVNSIGINVGGGNGGGSGSNNKRSSHMQNIIASCLLNSMCQCASPTNESSILEIICSQVSLYKFPGKR